MKNAVLYLNILFCATFMLACEQDVEVFHASGEDRLNFYYEENAEADSLIDYTFIYLPSEQMLDTIWFDVETSGYVTDYPRTISFEQMAVDSNAAIPDVHYVALIIQSCKMYMLYRLIPREYGYLWLLKRTTLSWRKSNLYYVSA